MNNYRSNADLGGMADQRGVLDEAEGTPFHAEWERRAFALTLAMGAGGRWNIDTSRSARETLTNYHQLSYYQVWFEALTLLLERHRLLDANHMALGNPSEAPMRALSAEAVATALAKGSPVVRPITRSARYVTGQRVRMQQNAPSHHCRVPGYVRGQIGTIERVHGVHVFAEAHAQGLGEDPQWLYGVVFEAGTLFGASAGVRSKVSIDAWEPTLEPI